MESFNSVTGAGTGRYETRSRSRSRSLSQTPTPHDNNYNNFQSSKHGNNATGIGFGFKDLNPTFQRSSFGFEFPSEARVVEKKTCPKSESKVKRQKLSYKDMIVASMEQLDLEKSCPTHSSQAIKAFIKSAFQVDTSHSSFSHFFSKAIEGAIKEGLIIRMTGQGLIGSFRLNRMDSNDFVSVTPKTKSVTFTASMTSKTPQSQQQGNRKTKTPSSDSSARSSSASRMPNATPMTSQHHQQHRNRVETVTVDNSRRLQPLGPQVSPSTPNGFETITLYSSDDESHVNNAIMDINLDQLADHLQLEGHQNQGQCQRSSGNPKRDVPAQATSSMTPMNFHGNNSMDEDPESKYWREWELEHLEGGKVGNSGPMTLQTNNYYVDSGRAGSCPIVHSAFFAAKTTEDLLRFRITGDDLVGGMDGMNLAPN